MGTKGQKEVQGVGYFKTCQGSGLYVILSPWSGLFLPAEGQVIAQQLITCLYNLPVHTQRHHLVSFGFKLRGGKFYASLAASQAFVLTSLLIQEVGSHPSLEK